MIELFEGDCLQEMLRIKDGSVDLILTDPPYGNMNGSGAAFKKVYGDKFSWDFTISPDFIHSESNRILRKKGRLILFSQQPYTTTLINESIPNLPHSYNIIWVKDSFANPLGVNKAPAGFYEDILVFSKNSCYEAKHPLRKIMLKYVYKYGKDFIITLFTKEGRYTSELSARVHASYKFGFNEGMRFDLMNEKMYNYLTNWIEFDETYKELRTIDEQYKKEYASTFNLWEGKKYKSNVLEYKKDYDGFHPTQKPVLLLEDLIKTYTNPGDTVLDFTMGSGSTGVACVNTGRKFIGIERDDKYFKIAEDRISEANLF